MGDIQQLISLFEDTGLFVLEDAACGETAAVHGDVDTSREGLDEGERAA